MSDSIDMFDAWCNPELRQRLLRELFPEATTPTHPMPTFSSIDSAPKTSKGWGDEVQIVNLDYCGKLLRFRKGAKLSMHAHAQKAESFLISSGQIRFYYIDTSNASTYIRLMGEGDIIHIPRMLPHQIEALEDTIVTEFSTHHEDADSFRYSPGNSQTLPESGWKS